MLLFPRQRNSHRKFGRSIGRGFDIRSSRLVGPQADPSGFEAESLALFTAMTSAGSTPDATRKTVINTLIAALKQCGAWSKFDRFYMLAGTTSGVGRLDWIHPGVDTLTTGGVAKFMANFGYMGNGSSTELHNGVLMNSGFPNYTQDNGHVSCWIYNSSGSLGMVGPPTSNNTIIIASTAHTFAVNAAGANGPVSPTYNPAVREGWLLANRTGSTASSGFFNGVNEATSANVSIAPPGQSFSILKTLNQFQTADGQVGFASFGASMESEAPAVYSALRNYFVSVGAILPPIETTWGIDFVSFPTLVAQSGNIEFKAGVGYALQSLVYDWENKLRITQPTEVGFCGFRRVNNILVNTATLATQNVTITSNTAQQAGNYILSFKGTGSVTCSGVGSVTLNGQGATARVACTPFAVAVGTLIVTVTGTITDAQLEKSDSLPSEYVSNGVLRPPYHGTWCDGVKYFAWQNGTTVNAELITEGVGTPLDDTVVRRGVSVMSKSNNLLQQSSNFGTAWVPVGTPTLSSSAITVGDIALDLIGDDDPLSLEGYTQVPGAMTGNTQKGVSFLISKGTSTSTVFKLLDTSAPATRLLGAVTWSGNTPIVTMTTGVFIGQTARAGDVWTIRLQSTACTAANGHSVEFYPASNSLLDVLNTGNVYIGGTQIEDRPFCTMLMPTTTSSFTRVGQAIYSDGINVSPNNGWLQAQGTMMAEAYFDTHDTGASGGHQYLMNAIIPASGDRLSIIRFEDTLRVQIYSTVAAVQQIAGGSNLNEVLSDNSIARVAWAFNSSGANLDNACCMNGGTVYTQSSAGLLPPATPLLITFGTDNITGTGVDQANGMIRRASYQPTRISNGAVQALSVNI